MKSRFISILLMLTVLPVTSQTDNVREIASYLLEINTDNGEEPEGAIVQSPWHSDYYNIIYTNKVPCHIVVSQMNDTLFEGRAAIHINGNTTALYSDPLNMPYKIKLTQDADLLARGNNAVYADKHWRLLKDATTLNTIVGMKVSELMDMEWTPAYKPCNVIINGDYRGCYLLTETVRRNNRCRIRCDKQNGSIVERDPYWWKESKFFASKWYCDSTNSMYRWTWKFPDDDILSNEQEKKMQQFINSLEQSIEDGNYEKYVDLPSWVKWILVHDILGTRDSGGANMYFKKDDSTLMTMPCLWDFDSSYEVTPGSFSRLHTSQHAYFSSLFNSHNRHFTQEYMSLWKEKKDYVISQLKDFISKYPDSQEGLALNASRELHNRRWKTNYPTVDIDAQRAMQWLNNHISLLDQRIQHLDDMPVLTVNGHLARYDSLTSVWLATLPETLFGNDCELAVNIDENWQITINNTKTDGTYTFKDITADNGYAISMTNTEGRTVNGLLYFTFLPLVQLKGNPTYDYQPAIINIANPQETTDNTLSATVKWRGGTTNMADKHKRNYNIKFDSDVSLLGMRTDNSWMLDAGQPDVFRLRNRIAMDLWNDMAQKPYYVSQEPKARNGVRGRVVEVFLNNEYRGIYNLSEKIDRKQLKLKKADAKGIHGVLYKGVTWQAMMGDSITAYDNYSPLLTGYEVKYPEPGDDCDSTDWRPLVDAVNRMLYLYYDDAAFCQEVEQWFDIPVLVDYSIFLSAINAIDNSGKNMYWAIYDKDTDNRLTPIPWDLDCTFGQRWGGQLTTGSNHASPQFLTDVVVEVFYSLYRTNALQFNNRLNDRYQKFRQLGGVLSTDSLISRFTHYYELLKKSGAAAREEARWSGDSDVWGDVIDFHAEYQYIRQWIEQHMSLIDQKGFPLVYNQAYFDSIHSSMPAMQYQVKANDAIYNLNGQRIRKDAKVLTPGIYIINRRKVVVR